MIFSRSDLHNDAAACRANTDPEHQALGDNLAFEENVGPDRCAQFEGATVGLPLRRALAKYYKDRVEGIARSHRPATFGPENAPALMSAGIEPNQVIARLERIDDTLNAAGLTFAQIEAAVAGPVRDAAIIDQLLRVFNGYANARPPFAAFTAELGDDLVAADWVSRLVSRLGLGHHLPPAGQVWHFAHMAYTVRDVFAAAGSIRQPFAVPTVLEAGVHPWFYPAPAGAGAGYVVDLAPPLGRNMAREFLHVRIEYREPHLIRVGTLAGSGVAPDLRALRDGHLGRLRSVTGRTTYAEMMVR